MVNANYYKKNDLTMVNKHQHQQQQKQQILQVSRFCITNINNKIMRKLSTYSSNQLQTRLLQDTRSVSNQQTNIHTDIYIYLYTDIYKY